MRKATYIFGCPICRKQFSYDAPGEPCCTGPNETADDHEMQVMRLIRIERREVGPQYAEKRAAGALLMPGSFFDATIEREVKIAVAK